MNIRFFPNTQIEPKKNHAKKKIFLTLGNLHIIFHVLSTLFILFKISPKKTKIQLNLFMIHCVTFSSEKKSSKKLNFQFLHFACYFKPLAKGGFKNIQKQIIKFWAFVPFQEGYMQRKFKKKYIFIYNKPKDSSLKIGIRKVF